MPAGEPGGPDSEVFYDFGIPHDSKYGDQCHPNCDCGRFLEIGNSVFMQYQKQAGGSLKELDQKNVDFGGGLERIEAYITNEIQAMEGHQFVTNKNMTVSNQVANGTTVYSIDPSPTQKIYYIPTSDAKRIIVISRTYANAAFITTFDQILSTFKFNDSSPTNKPTSKPITSAPILDTTGWATGSLANVSFMYPLDYSPHQHETSMDLIKPTQYGGFTISVNVYTYDGGSRRQWFIERLHSDGGDSYASIEKYTLAKEVKLGTVDALDFWMDGGWWQGGYTSPIIIANGKTIVTIIPSSGRTYDPTTGIISRIDVLDTIGSTIRFN